MQNQPSSTGDFPDRAPNGAPIARDPSIHMPASAPVPPPPPRPAPAPPPPARKRMVPLLFLALVLVFVYHLFADRITPYTAQATVDTFLVQIAPEVSGPVVSVDVVDNQTVVRGQPLFGIDPAPFEIALRAAQANLAVATQGADASMADVRVADANLQGRQVDLATSQELGRIVLDLSAKRALSETSAIRARADIAKTRAEIQRAEAEAERARIKLAPEGTTTPQVQQAQIAVEQAQLDLRRATVTAPADGAITNLRLSPGQFANRGQPVLSFMAEGTRWVTAAMRENQLGNIAPGNRVLVAFDDRPGEVFSGKVDSVGLGVTQGSETPNGQLAKVDAPTGWLREPQRFPVRVVLDPPEPGSRPLPQNRSGAQASVVVLTRESSLMNPLARLWIRAIAILSYLR